MGPLTVGDIVLVAFPFADFTNFKKRPAIVVAKAEFDNLILCQITSKANTSKSAIQLAESDFRVGSLQVDSFMRVDKLFTVEKSVIKSHLGSLENDKTNTVKKAIRDLFI